MSEKLKSRKFWVAVAGFVGPLLLSFGVDSGTVQSVAALIISGGSIITYLIVQGNQDIADSYQDDDEY